MTHKRRTRSHVIDDLSFNHLERLVLLCAWSAERTQHDYGLDATIHTYDHNGEIQAGWIYVQLKGTDSLTFDRQRTAVTCRIDCRDLAFWTAIDASPVILIRYDAQHNQAYWLHIQDHFKDRYKKGQQHTGQTVTVHIPVANIVDCNAIAEFARRMEECRRKYQE